MPDADAPIPQEILDALDATQKIKYRRRYNIHDWYWLADDGRVFTSARRLTVDESDASYQAFIGGAMATPWPRDGHKPITGPDRIAWRPVTAKT